jgi:hypothetical protein
MSIGRMAGWMKVRTIRQSADNGSKDLTSKHLPRGYGGVPSQFQVGGELQSLRHSHI